MRYFVVHALLPQLMLVAKNTSVAKTCDDKGNRVLGALHGDMILDSIFCIRPALFLTQNCTCYQRIFNEGRHDSRIWEER